MSISLQHRSMPLLCGLGRGTEFGRMVHGQEHPIDAIVLVAGGGWGGQQPQVRQALGAVCPQHSMGVLPACVREGPQLHPGRRAAAAAPRSARPGLITPVQHHQEVADAAIEPGGRPIYQQDVILIGQN